MVGHIDLGELGVVPVTAQPCTVALEQSQFNDPVDFSVHAGEVLSLDGVQRALPEIHHAPHFCRGSTGVFAFFQPGGCALA